MDVVITGWGVVSSIGIGNDDFVEGVRSRSSGMKPIEGFEDSSFPMEQACIVKDYNVAKVLGKKKGTRVLDRTAALAVGATAMAIRDAGVEMTEDLEHETGVVLGTLNGSVSRIVELLRDTQTTEEPWMVSPEAFPNTVMNFAAGQCSIWHRLRAVNTTISGGKLACILALRYARRMLQFGHAGAILAGSTEEFSEMIAWGAHKTAPEGATPPLGEGCGMFFLESAERAEKAGRKPRATLLSCEMDFHNEGDQGETVAACIKRALDKAGATTKDVWAIAESGLGVIDHAEARGLELALAGHTPAHRYPVGRHMGYCVSASAALQMASLLALFRGEEGQGRIGLVTSASVNGSVGCAVMRGA